MKKFLNSILLGVMLLLTGCGGVHSQKEEYKGEPDSQNYWGGSGHELAASDDGYYFAESDMLYFYDRTSKQCVPVCDKTDCEHKRGDTDCNAFFNGYLYYISHGIWYYDHALYIIGVESETSSNICLYRISEDGSKRTKLGTLFKGDRQSGISIEMNLYCNYAYFSPGEFSEGKKEHKLYRIALTKGAKPQEIHSFEGKDAEYARIKASNGKLYFMTLFATDEGEYSGNINQYDLKTGKTSVMVENNNNEYAVYNDNLYYIAGGNVKKKNIKTGKETDFYKNEEEAGYRISCDGTYIFLDNGRGLDIRKEDYENRKIYVLNMNGKTINTMQIGNDNEMLFGDQSYFFSYVLNGKGGEWQCFPKKELANGDVKWETIFKGEDITVE